jgi:hypothetical protein
MKHLHLDDASLVSLDTGALAGNLGGENQVLQELLMDRSKSARARALLLDTRVAGGLGHDAALTNEDNVAVGELLLELASESAMG